MSFFLATILPVAAVSVSGVIAAFSNMIQPEFSYPVEARLPFVDKSLLIPRIFEQNSNRAISISYPKQIGKSFNLDMISNYVVENGNKSLFEGLKISNTQYQHFERKYMHKFPVIQMSFKNVLQEDFEAAKQEIHSIISDVFQGFMWLKESLKHLERTQFDGIVEKSATDQVFDESITFLSNLLVIYHHKLPVVIIDEVNTPLTTALLHNYSHPMNMKMKLFYGSIVQSRMYEKAIFSGIQPIFLTSTFGDITYMHSYTLEDEEFDGFFGFSEPEVSDLIKNHYPSKTYLTNDVLKWSGSYKIGQTDVYSPASVFACLSNAMDKFVPNRGAFTNTQTTFSENLLQNKGLLPQLAFQLLVRNQTLEKKFSPSFLLEDIMYDEATMWRYCMFSGLITVNEFPREENQYTVNITIPGLEMKKVIGKELQKLIALEALPDYALFVKYLNGRDFDAAQKYLSIYLTRAGVYLFGSFEKIDMNRLMNYLKTVFSEFEKEYCIRSEVRVTASKLEIWFYKRGETYPLVLWFQMKPSAWDKIEGLFTNHSVIELAKEIIWFAIKQSDN